MADAIESARVEGRTAHLALAGGNTPRPAYVELAGLVDDWGGVELWLGDERLVPLDHPDSNYRLAEETLGGTGVLIHPMETGGSAEAAADAYGELLAERIPADDEGVPRLELALLGLGEDGHTASLFPGNAALEITGRLVVAVHDSPKPPPDRVSLSLEVLRGARAAVILAVGDGKAGPVARIMAGPDEATPASLLATGQLELITDRPAAAQAGPA